MNERNLVKRCLIDKDAIETHPFKKDEYSGTIVMRHKSNNKWFALIFELDGKLCINLKAQPQLLALLREQYDGIMPAWHMNKKHWCKIDVNNTPVEVLDELIKISFDITASKRKFKIKDKSDF